MKRLALGLVLLAACKSAPPPKPVSDLTVGSTPRTAGAAGASGAKTCGDDSTEPDDAPFGKTIAAVCIEGASIGGRGVLEKAVFLKPGAKLIEAELRITLESVHRTGILEDAAVYTRKLGAGVAVVLRVHERPRVGEVKVEGQSAVNVQAELAPGRTPLHAGEYYDPAYAFQRANMLREMYVEEGFEDTTVTPKVTKAAQEGVVDVHMVIVEGTRSKVGKVTWAGVSKPMEAPLLKASGLEADQPLSSALMGTLNLRMETTYMDRGYVTAKVTAERGTKGADGTVPFSVNVTEGPLFHLGKIALTKSNLDAAATRGILAQMKSRPGSLFSRSTLVGDIKAVQAAFASGGRKVEVTPLTNVDQAKHLVDLELEISDEK